MKTHRYDTQCSENIPMVSTTTKIDNSPKSKALNIFSNTTQYCDIESDKLSWYTYHDTIPQPYKVHIIMIAVCIYVCTYPSWNIGTPEWYWHGGRSVPV